MPTTAVVVALRDAAAHVDGLLAHLVPELDAAGAELVVVDDGSVDDTADRVAAAGFAPVRLAVGGGPYRARNEGWRSTDAEVVVFTDMRCRPEPGWLSSLVDAATAPGVAIAGGEVLTVAAPGAPATWAHRGRNLSPEHTLRHWFKPYVPNCNMAMRRTVLEAVGGFDESRSTGDADLCWRAADAGLGEVVLAPDAVVTWEPRTTWRELSRQYHRYGSGMTQVLARHGQRQPDAQRSMPRHVLAATKGWVVRTAGSREPLLELVGSVAQVSYAAGVLSVERRRATTPS